MKLISQDIIKCAKIAAKDERRPVLNGVCIDNEVMVATDSYKLVEYQLARGQGEKLSHEDFPMGMDDSSIVESLEAPVIIKSQQIIKRQKFLETKSTLPVLHYSALCANTNRNISIMSTNLEHAQKNIYTKIEGTYPDYKKIFPTEKPSFEVAIDAKHLKELLECFINDDDRQIKITCYGELEPLLITGIKGNQGIRGIVMPIRL